MGCFSSKSSAPKASANPAKETETRELLPLGPPQDTSSAYHVKVVKANGDSEAYVPRPKPDPKQYDKNAHITLKVEDLKLAACVIQTTPGMRVQKLYDQVRTQMAGVGEFMLFWTGKELTEGDEKTLGECGITSDETVDLVRKVK